MTLLKPVLAPTLAWVIIPAHNRRTITLRCLENLRANGDLDSFHLLVIDDGSTDGTAEDILAAYPQAEVVRGDGTLWWTGAIGLGMRRALDAGAEAVFWLNDDCHPHPGALKRLLASALQEDHITAAQPLTTVGVIFSGFRKTWRGLQSVTCDPASHKDVDACNGNCVCVPRRVVERIGYPDHDAFPQYHGDTDYTLRATRAGIRCVIIGEATCTSETPASVQIESWLLSETPFLTHWRRFSSVKSAYYFPAFFRFTWRHWGGWGGALFCFPYVKLAVMRLARTLIPRRIFLRYFASRSVYWRMQQQANER